MTDQAPKPENPASKPSPIPTLDPGSDYEMVTTTPDSSKIMTIAMGLILAVAIAGGVIAIAPEVKKVGAQKEKIAQLEAELAQAKVQQAPASSQVETQLSDVQAKMAALGEQAKQLQASVVNGDMSGKLSQIETKISQMAQQSQILGFSGMIARVQSLQQSPEGSKILDSIVGTLAASPEGSDIGQNLEALRASDPNVAQVTEGVAPEDMKAAAMLIGLSQLRHSLSRSNDSFDNDLVLLKKTVPADNPELLAAIDRLAPQAKYGVLTPQGLSQEFRGITGEIVSASLSGQDVSLQEKAKARMANVCKVEKNGERISGTETQIAIAAAQKQLDTGNVQGAVDILNTLKGPERQQTQPFLDKAQATLMAGNLQTTISQNVRAAVQTLMNGGMPNGVVNPYGAGAITNQIKSMLPGATAPVQGSMAPQ